jgi:hypothetical protein
MFYANLEEIKKSLAKQKYWILTQDEWNQLSDYIIFCDDLLSVFNSVYLNKKVKVKFGDSAFLRYFDDCILEKSEKSIDTQDYGLLLNRSKKSWINETHHQYNFDKLAMKDIKKTIRESKKINTIYKIESTSDVIPNHVVKFTLCEISQWLTDVQNRIKNSE